MKKSIKYYKDASSFDDSKAKNNLAMIYNHGIFVEKNEEYSRQYAIELFKESIKLNDQISMYNLAHIYFYDETGSDNNEAIIDLLIKSSNEISLSIELLSLVLIKKLKNITHESIELELKTNQSIDYDQIKKLANGIYMFIEIYSLENPTIYEYLYFQLKSID